MQFAVMRPAQRNGKFVADFCPSPAAQSEADAGPRTRGRRRDRAPWPRNAGAACPLAAFVEARPEFDGRRGPVRFGWRGLFAGCRLELVEPDLNAQRTSSPSSGAKVFGLGQARSVRASRSSSDPSAAMSANSRSGRITEVSGDRAAARIPLAPLRGRRNVSAPVGGI
jgi:hypothetical protein